MKDTKTDKNTLKFQQDCFASYVGHIRKFVRQIPDPYVYPDGNPIRPVIPVKTVKNSIMLIGAFPSARFEKRNGVLIPAGDNLSPFASEEYFDGETVRRQASRVRLEEDYFRQLHIDSNNIWITDIVKVYLFPEKHIKNCKLISPRIEFVNTHRLFKQIAAASSHWIEREIIICNPKLIITLGEIPARTISRDWLTPNKKLLNGVVKEVALDKIYKIAHLGHPEIMRLDKNWRIFSEKAISMLSEQIKIIQTQQ